MNPSEPVKRYTIEGLCEVTQTDNGEWITASDHQRIVAALEARERKLREACEVALSAIGDQQLTISLKGDMITPRLDDARYALRAALAGKANPQ